MKNRLETLDERNQMLQAQLDIELKLIESSLVYEDHILRMKIAMGQLNEQQASSQLSAIAKNLFDNGVNDNDTPRRMSVYRQAFDTFLNFIDNRIKTTTTWPPGSSIASYRSRSAAEISRIRIEYVKQIGNTDELAKLLDYSNNILGWTYGHIYKTDGTGIFAESRIRAHNAIQMIYAREKTEFGLQSSAGTSIADKGEKTTVLLSIEVEDPSAGVTIAVIDPADISKTRTIKTGASTMIWYPGGSSLMAWNYKIRLFRLSSLTGA